MSGNRGSHIVFTIADTLSGTEVATLKVGREPELLRVHLAEEAFYSVRLDSFQLFLTFI